MPAPNAIVVGVSPGVYRLLDEGGQPVMVQAIPGIPTPTQPFLTTTARGPVHLLKADGGVMYAVMQPVGAIGPTPPSARGASHIPVPYVLAAIGRLDVNLLEQGGQRLTCQPSS